MTSAIPYVFALGAAVAIAVTVRTLRDYLPLIRAIVRDALEI
tara:strand:+ start:840 stop:965 length:126 start_codon:yes stop_codon:yes gene_type:complete